MSRERLPVIGSFGTKAVKPPLFSPALQRPHQTNRRKLKCHHQTSPSSSSHPHPGPSSILLSDSTMTPWGGLDHSESSFTSIPPAPPPPPLSTPSTPYRGRQEEDEESSGSSFNSEIPSPPLVIPQNSAAGLGGDLRLRRRVLPPRQVPRPPRLPPLRPISNLSFSRSFTFSFFELPLHQSPRCRAERIKNLLLLLKQIHF